MKLSVIMNKLRSFSLLLLIFLSAFFATCQEPEHPSLPNQITLRGAPNSWQAEPINPERQKDTVSLDERKKRDAFWAPLLINQGSKVTSGGFTASDSPEVPVFGDSVWLIVRFEDHRVYSVNNEFNRVYTEMNFRVERVIAQPKEKHLIAGDLVDVAFPGGKLQTETRVATLQVSPLRHFFQPGKEYLMNLLYVPDGNFYMQSKRWLLSGDQVLPDEDLELRRFNRGEAHLSGHSTSEATEKIKEILRAAGMEVEP